ncbi:MAG: hypothetical protein SVX43_06375, partial [Cyanobacteriota bacterium]|nr:hypothetical protein [Cyanobacteriota bacterium]
MASVIGHSSFVIARSLYLPCSPAPLPFCISDNGYRFLFLVGSRSSNLHREEKAMKHRDWFVTDKGQCLPCTAV